MRSIIGQGVGGKGQDTELRGVIGSVVLFAATTTTTAPQSLRLRLQAQKRKGPCARVLHYSITCCTRQLAGVPLPEAVLWFRSRPRIAPFSVSWSCHADFALLGGLYGRL